MPEHSALTELDCVGCPPGVSIFTRVRVLPTITQGTRVEWTLNPLFAGTEPYSYQLQTGRTGSNASDDWIDIGEPEEDVTQLLDSTPRVFGQTQWTHYRIKLTTSDQNVITCYSLPQSSWGDLDAKSWRLWKSRFRTLQLGLRLGTGGHKGFLLKRRRTGIAALPADRVTDYLTGEIISPDDPVTLGTGFAGGYFAAIPCVYASLSPITRNETVDPAGVRGSINDPGTVTAKMMAVPMLDAGDIWVDASNDFRWQIGEIKNLEEIRGVPLICEVELTLLPFTDVVYKIAIPEQIPG